LVTAFSPDFQQDFFEDGFFEDGLFEDGHFEAAHWSGYTRQKRDQQKRKMSCRPFARGRSVQPGRPIILFRICDH
jgi:hypothetical protein